MKARIYGNAAIVMGRTIVQFRAKDGTEVDIEVQFTDTVMLTNGRWQLVAGQVARLEPKPSWAGRGGKRVGVYASGGTSPLEEGSPACTLPMT